MITGSLSKILLKEISDSLVLNARRKRQDQDTEVHKSGSINTKEGQIIHKKNNRAIELMDKREKRLKKLSTLQRDSVRIGK